jgi:hypothetical protein
MTKEKTLASYHEICPFSVNYKYIMFYNTGPKANKASFPRLYNSLAKDSLETYLISLLFDEKSFQDRKALL